MYQTEKIFSVYTEKNIRPRELQASQSHLRAWQDYGVDSPENRTKAHGKQGGDWGQPTWLH